MSRPYEIPLDNLKTRLLELTKKSKKQTKAITPAMKREESALKAKIKQSTEEIEQIFGKQAPKLTRKTSLLVKLFNTSLTKNQIKRENYWSEGFTGGNMLKFLSKVDAVYDTFIALIKQRQMLIIR